jgi:hypothetical protein
MSGERGSGSRPKRAFSTLLVLPALAVALRSLAASVGAVAPGEARPYRITLPCPAVAADPSLQGAATTPGLQFTGVSQ